MDVRKRWVRRPHLHCLRQDAAQRRLGVLRHGQRCADGGQALLLHQLHQRGLRRQPALRSAASSLFLSLWIFGVGHPN